MKTVHAIAAFLAMLGLCGMPLTAVCQVASPHNAKPANYDEIKALLDSYASAIDNYGERQDGRTTLLAKGDEETLALIELLKEKISTQSLPQEKSAIVSILANNQATDKKRSAKLLSDVLPEKVEDWDGQGWIVETIRFLTKVDPELALRVDRKAMGGSMSEVKYAAIKSLGTVGKLEDVQTLEVFRMNWQTLTAKSGDSLNSDTYIDATAVETELNIYKRIIPDGW